MRVRLTIEADRDMTWVHEQRVEFHGRRLAWTSLADISPALQTAVIAPEDRRFYRHVGVDNQALLGAVARGLVGKRLRGASTITMQLVTLIDPQLRHRGTPRTLAQKLRQMRLARALERSWPKVRILEAYLSLVSYRGHCTRFRHPAGTPTRRLCRGQHQRGRALATRWPGDRPCDGYTAVAPCARTAHLGSGRSPMAPPRHGELRGASGVHEGRYAAVSEALTDAKPAGSTSGTCLSCSSQTVASLSLGAR